MDNREDLFTNSIDYKKIIDRLLTFKKSFIITTILLLFLAFFYNKIAPIKFSNSTTILISDDDQSNFLAGAGTGGMLQGLGMFSNQKFVDNEIEIIQSYSNIRNVIDLLDIKTSYYAYNNNIISDLIYSTPLIPKKDLYKKSPIRVVVDPSFAQAVYLDFFVKFINENEFQLMAYGNDIPLYNYIDDATLKIIPDIKISWTRFKFGEEIRTKYFNFTVFKTDYFDKHYTRDKSLYFHFNNMNYLTLEYIKNTTAAVTSEKSTMLKITLKGRNAERITDFLNGLTNVYLQRNLDKKNSMATSTVDFIDTQISDISDSLTTAEANLKSFRTSNQVMDLSFQGQQVFEKLSQLETEKANLEVQKQYYSYLQKYIITSDDISKLTAPSSMNVVDPILTNIITQLLTLNAERSSLLKNRENTQNLYLQDINIQIENLKQTLKENVANSLNTLNISLNEINYRISKLSGQISQMPKTELQLKGIERKFKINDEIYTFLLQKRSEAQIARASSMPDYEIIDPARRVVSRRVSPKPKLNYVLALFLGIFLPASFILLKDFLNNKIVDPAEIEKISNKPVLGKVFRNYRKQNMIVAERPNSSVSESFRAIRTNFEFFSEGGKKQVILVTSSSSGEGKSFCSMNIASVFALNGHRTALLEFDLRRPKIHQEFGSSNIIGISSYLIDKAVLEDIILPTQVENLDLISAGPAAPNPAELISGERTSEFIEQLKEMYDYIVIDSAPAGILTETYMLMKHADVNIYVVRLGFTIKEAFHNSFKTIADKFDNISMLINDVDIRQASVKYGYDNKYYTDDRSRGFLRRIFSRKAS